MDAFLTRFYDEVDRNLQSPHSQKRYTKAERYADLYIIQKRLFERFLGVGGQESSIGRTEIDITLVSGKEFYDLPWGFRQFISLEKRVGGNPDNVEMKLNTVPVYSQEPGIEIISAQRGFRVQPVPDDSVAGTWTLVFNKAPVRLHYAQTRSIRNGYTWERINYDGGWTAVSPDSANTATIQGEGKFTPGLVGHTVVLYLDNYGTQSATRVITGATTNLIYLDRGVPGMWDAFVAESLYMSIDTGGKLSWIHAGTPPSGGGELVKCNNYYTGSVLRVYSAPKNAPQSMVISGYAGSNSQLDSDWVFEFRGAWGEIPFLDPNTAMYEIVPDLDEGYDSLYALDVAILAASRRREIRRRAGLSAERHEAFQAALSYYANNTIDRAPSRIIPVRYPTVDPYGGGII